MTDGPSMWRMMKMAPNHVRCAAGRHESPEQGHQAVAHRASAMAGDGDRQDALAVSRTDSPAGPSKRRGIFHKSRYHIAAAPEEKAVKKGLASGHLAKLARLELCQLDRSRVSP